MHRDQLRARNAFAFVTALVEKKKIDREAFLGLARKLPVMLQTNGLLATWGHLLAKGRRSQDCEEMARALAQHFQSYGFPEASERPDKIFDHWLDAQTGLSSPELRKRTAEAIEYAVWLKRAAEALCEVEATPTAEGSTQTAEEAGAPS